MKHARSYECFLLHPPSKATLWFTSRSVERDVEIQSSGLLVTKLLPLRIPLEIPMKSSSPPSPSPVNETCENRCRWSTEKSSRKRRFDAVMHYFSAGSRREIPSLEAFPSSSPRCPVTIIHFDRSKRADLLLLLWARLSEERSTEINCAIKKWKGRGRGAHEARVECEFVQSWGQMLYRAVVRNEWRVGWNGCSVTQLFREKWRGSKVGCCIS